MNAVDTIATPARNRVSDHTIDAGYAQQQRHRSGDCQHYQREGRSSHGLTVHLVQRAKLRKG